MAGSTSQALCWVLSVHHPVYSSEWNSKTLVEWWGNRSLNSSPTTLPPGISVWWPPNPSQMALVVKNQPVHAGAIRGMSLIPGLGRSPGGGHGNPAQYSCPEVHGKRSLVGYSQWGCKEPKTAERLSTHAHSDGYFEFTISWWLRQSRICLQCRRSGFNPWVRKVPWRREWWPTPVFLPGKVPGQRSLAG